MGTLQRPSLNKARETWNFFGRLHSSWPNYSKADDRYFDRRMDALSNQRLNKKTQAQRPAFGI